MNMDSIQLMDVDVLKHKAIELYRDLLNRAKKGYQDDYSLLLNIICFISLPTDIDNKEFIKENLLNQNDTLYLQLGREGRFNTMF